MISVFVEIGSDFGTKYGSHLTAQKWVMFMSATKLQRELIVDAVELQ